MSSNTDWQDNFIKRCESVGWQVDLSTSNHYKVSDANGKFLFTFSKTPGGHRAMYNAVSSAKKCGIEALETQLKLRLERERLQKIEDDRLANEAKLAGIKEQFDAQDDEVDGDHPNLGYVNGVQIVAIAPAKVKTPVMSEAKPMADAEELMLLDHSVVYRCAKAAATTNHPELEGLCHRTFETVDSLRAHITFHSRKTMPLTPRQRQAQTKPKETTKVPTKAPKTVEAPSSTDALAKRVTAALDAVGMLAAAANSMKDELTELQRDLSGLQVADPETVKKAAQFDNLKAMLS